MTRCYAVIEAGGTKFNCALMNAQRDILAHQRIPTTTFSATLDAIEQFFTQQRQRGFQFDQLGVASFGPLQLDPASPHYGDILQTPKPGWQNQPLRKELQRRIGCDVVVDTDVNAAALAEYRWGSGQGANIVAYITVGTGVGGGIVVDGKPLHGALHPEIGHMWAKAENQTWQCHCPYHEHCVEGYVSGPAIAKHTGQQAEHLSQSDPVWDDVASVLSILCCNLLMTLSTQKIILGGGVMAQSHLLDRVIQHTQRQLGGYLPIQDSLREVIVLPGLAQSSGIQGAFALLKSSHFSDKNTGY